MIIIIMYLRVWAICMYMYVWKQHTEIPEMTITNACTDSEARKRREDTGWVSKFINILLYIVHLILVNGNLLAVGHLHVCCLGS